MTEITPKKPVQPAQASVSMEEAPVTNTEEAPKKAPKVWTLNELTRAQRGIKRNQMNAQPLSKPVISPAATAAQIKNEN